MDGVGILVSFLLGQKAYSSGAFAVSFQGEYKVLDFIFWT